MIPAAVDTWIPRERERKILEEIFLNPAAGDAPPRAVMRARRGLGKTAVAASFCHAERVLARFGDDILWADLTPRHADGGMLPVVPLSENLRKFQDAFAARVAGKDWLLVLDGVEEADVAVSFLAAARDCPVLVITREATVARDLGVREIEIGGLDARERLDALRKHVPESLHGDEALAALAQLLPETPREVELAGMELSLRLAGAPTVENLRAAAAFLTGAFTSNAEVVARAGLEAQTPERPKIKTLPNLKKLVTEASQMLRGGEPAPEAMLAKAEECKNVNEFAYARKLLARAAARLNEVNDSKTRVKIIQRHALCTYKDPDQPLLTRLERALEILKQAEPLETTNVEETLGLAGAIYKRLWEADGQRQHLERSLGYYLRGYQLGVRVGYGYTAINAAYILDCLAAQEKQAADEARVSSDSVRVRRRQARDIREEILRELPPLRQAHPDLHRAWWFNVTLAEAAFGVGAYQEAAFWLALAKEAGAHDWEYESTARQLAALARIQTIFTREDPAPGVAPAPPSADAPSETWNVIARFLGSQTAADSKFVGKVGLALSGGGFRASLFHIGVLARLAELDLLRSVEVLSCVSGGSILGAHYYLELKNLLQTKTDAEITPQDYIDIVKRIARDFVAGVQCNIRTQVAGSLRANWNMMFRKNFSRTARVGDLYEQHLYKGIPGVTLPILLTSLPIKPKGETDDFRPKYENWRRKAKVPQLILNATSLNTGHNWQFTATFMGEPPGAIDATIDGNERLRRMYFNQQAPPPHDKTRLGHAVAASACVPALFEPLPLDGLYEDRVVRLVDGGVHDNQGIAGLLEQDANFLIVSDASGQMAVQPNPGAGLLDVPLRANDVLMARVREAEAKDLRARARSGLLRGLMFMHMKKDLGVDPVDWVDCADPFNASEDARPERQRGTETTYQIDKKMQEAIAGLRTDLDSFSEAEACALMTSGYLMSTREFADRIRSIGRTTMEENSWEFLRIAPDLRSVPNNRDAAANLLRLLKVGNKLAFKIWYLSRPLRWIAMVLGVLAALAGLTMVVLSLTIWKDHPLLTAGAVGAFVASLIGAAILGKTAMKIADPEAELRRLLINVGICVGGYLVAQLHLRWFDRWFLEYGRIQTLSSLKLPK